MKLATLLLICTTFLMPLYGYRIEICNKSKMPVTLTFIGRRNIVGYGYAPSNKCTIVNIDDAVTSVTMFDTWEFSGHGYGDALYTITEGLDLHFKKR